MPLDPLLLAALPAAVRPRERNEWVNWHGNVRQPIDAYFDIANPPGRAAMKRYRETAGNIQTVLRLAAERHASVRPFGGTWSFSDIAASPDWMVDTGYLNWAFPLTTAYLDGAYAGRTNELFLVQGGIKISQLNRVLEKRFGRSLNTCGASNGQTLAGAISTGTHGSALDFGGMHNHVVGLHLVTGAGEQVWLERASNPATTTRFLNLTGATVVRDDALFDAARVGLGAMGFIIGVLIDTVPLYNLTVHRRWQPYNDALRHTLNTLDFSALDLPGSGNSRPYFCMTVLNPFATHEISVKVMLATCHDGKPIDYAQHSGGGPGYELLGAIGKLTDAVGGAIPTIVNAMLKQRLKTISNKRGTLGETFDFTTERSGAAGSALGVAIADTERTLTLLIDELQAGPIAPVILAQRFVQPTGATLEFTRHEPTCVIDVDGVHSSRTLNYLQRVWARLENEGIAFTQHWGKLNNYSAANLSERFPAANIAAFRRARHALLPSAEQRELFATPHLRRIGLAD